MNLKKKFSIRLIAKETHYVELASALRAVTVALDKTDCVWVGNLWAYPHNKKINLICVDLAIASKINIYDTLNVLLISSDSLLDLLRQEWIRNYFAKQMPEFMVEQVLGLIAGGEDPKTAWKYCIETWIPDNETAKQLLNIQG
jgi:hypothetical protein